MEHTITREKVQVGELVPRRAKREAHAALVLQGINMIEWCERERLMYNTAQKVLSRYHPVTVDLVQPIEDLVAYFAEYKAGEITQ